MKIRTAGYKKKLVACMCACAPAVIIALIFYALPIVYENADDTSMASILQGEKGLGSAPDAHSLFIHYFLGWIVSSLSNKYQEVAWFGFLLGSLYVLAYTVIVGNLRGINCFLSPVRRMATVLVFVLAFALLPLLLLQFTVVAGLLALAGMLPWVRHICLAESCSFWMWGIATLCLLLGLMVRIQMAAMIMATCLPALVLAMLYGRDWRRIGLFASYFFGVGAFALGMYYLDQYNYATSPAHARLLEFSRLRMDYTDFQKPTFKPAVYGSVGWSANDYEMFSVFMGVDNGPFRLENLQRLRATAQMYAGNTYVSVARDGKQSDSTTKRSGTKEKLSRILQQRGTQAFLLTLYLSVIIGTGVSLIAGGVVLRDWKSVSLSSMTAFATAAWYGLTAIVMDRAVFRVLFPLAYVFLIIAIVVFPWGRLRAFRSLSRWRKWSVIAALGSTCFMGSMGILMGVAQIRPNRDQRLFYTEMIKEIRARIGARHTIVAWPEALPAKYQSPFVKFQFPFQEEGDIRGATTIYQVDGCYGSYPTRLNSFKQHFGEDIYAGLLYSGSVHLFSSRDQLEQLKRFSAEHYGRSLSGTQLGEFQMGVRKTTVWVLGDAENSS